MLLTVLTAITENPWWVWLEMCPYFDLEAIFRIETTHFIRFLSTADSPFLPNSLGEQCWNGKSWFSWLDQMVSISKMFYHFRVLENIRFTQMESIFFKTSGTNQNKDGAFAADQQCKYSWRYPILPYPLRRPPMKTLSACSSRRLGQCFALSWVVPSNNRKITGQHMFNHRPISDPRRRKNERDSRQVTWRSSGFYKNNRKSDFGCGYSLLQCIRSLRVRPPFLCVIDAKPIFLFTLLLTHHIPAPPYSFYSHFSPLESISSNNYCFHLKNHDGL